MNYAKYCGPRRSVHPLAAGVLPPVGAHLITPWLGYTHHGIYVGDGKVVQYGALNVRPHPQAGRRSDDRRVSRKAGPVFVVAHAERSFDAAEVIAARGRGSARSGTGCSPTTANTSSNGACTTSSAASRWRSRSISRAGSASGSSRRCCGALERAQTHVRVQSAQPGTSSSRSQRDRLSRFPAGTAWAALPSGTRPQYRPATFVGCSSGASCAVSVSPIGRTTLPAGWGSATSKPACIS